MPSSASFACPRCFLQAKMGLNPWAALVSSCRGELRTVSLSGHSHCCVQFLPGAAAVCDPKNLILGSLLRPPKSGDPEAFSCSITMGRGAPQLSRSAGGWGFSAHPLHCPSGHCLAAPRWDHGVALTRHLGPTAGQRQPEKPNCSSKILFSIIGPDRSLFLCFLFK